MSVTISYVYVVVVLLLECGINTVKHGLSYLIAYCKRQDHSLALANQNEARTFMHHTIITVLIIN